MSHPSSWAGLVGLWTFDGRSATYRGPQTQTPRTASRSLTLQFRGGVFGADITLDKPEAAGRLVFGHEAETGAYYSAGVGGGAAAYVLDQFVAVQAELAQAMEALERAHRESQQDARPKSE